MKKEIEVEIIEEYRYGVLVSRKINGKEVPIIGMEENFIQFQKAKELFGEYNLPTSKIK